MQDPTQYRLVEAIRAITASPPGEALGKAEREVAALLRLVDPTMWPRGREEQIAKAREIAVTANEIARWLASDKRALRTAAEAYFGGDFSQRPS